MAYSKEKQQKLISSLTNIGALAGNNSIDVADGVKGLEMNLEQTKCNEQAKSVRDGLFKVAIIGTFSSGKSTVINALIGSMVLPVASGPCTGILTFIQFGENENFAEVYMKDEILNDGSVKPGDCLHMDITEFHDKFRYTLDDEKEFKEKGTVSRFAKVKYAIVYCSKSLIEGGVRIIDTPGLEDKTIATELALQIAQEAQAIIYITSEKGFTDSDKEYIETNFRNCPNNVFFVINKFDRVKKEERETGIHRAKLIVTSVFTDQNGVNEELLNRRVFAISALRALDSRRGYTYDSEKEKEVPLKDEERNNKFEISWFGPFEKELENFLTTDERCIAQYRKCFSQMSSTYRNAEAKTKGNIAIFENEIKFDTEQKNECAKIIEDIKTGIKLTEASFDNCSLEIQNKVSSLINDCVNSIDSSWEQDLMTLKGEVNFGTRAYLNMAISQINIFKSEEEKAEKIGEILQPFTDVVAKYFIDKIDSFLDDNKIVLENVIRECEKKLNTSIGQTDEMFQGLVEHFGQGNKNTVQLKEQSWLQNAISLYLGDISAFVKTAAGGKTTWIEFIKKAVLNYVWQSILIFGAGGPGAVIALIIEFFQTQSNKNTMVLQIMNNIKDGIVKEYKTKLSEAINSINKKIKDKMEIIKNKDCEAFRMKLADEELHIKKIESALSDQNFNLEDEKKRYDNILNTMYKEAAEAYETVFEKSLTLTQFKQL